MSAGSASVLSLPPRLPHRPVAVLLDFDGVIVQSVQLKNDAYLDIYAGESPDKLAAVSEYQRAHGGITRRLKFRHFERHIFGRDADAERIEQLSREYTRLVHDAGAGVPVRRRRAGFPSPSARQDRPARHFWNAHRRALGHRRSPRIGAAIYKRAWRTRDEARRRSRRSWPRTATSGTVCLPLATPRRSWTRRGHLACRSLASWRVTSRTRSRRTSRRRGPSTEWPAGSGSRHSSIGRAPTACALSDELSAIE